MLPGFDLGDSASFQTMAGSPFITPRDGYPLYYAVGGLFVRAMGGEPAAALNFASVVAAALACGVLALVAAELAGSTLAGSAAALLFAGSYTFWSQAVIAEVYALHLLLVALTMLLLLRWSCRPTVGRLALFFAAYAVSFGNHLSMILLAPAYTLFLFSAAPGGWRSMLAPRVVGLACALAAVGAAQYAWNLSALWRSPAAPDGFLAALETFWFDVTKADWRDTMVLRIPPSMMIERLRMYAFDVRQQFGVIATGVALAGAVCLIRTDRRRAVLVVTAYAIPVSFALGYNVGDSHVFFLPSHLMLALLVAPGLGLLEKTSGARALAIGLAVVLAGSRMYRDYPALDRSADQRPTQAIESLTEGLDDRRAVLLIDLNWQLENGLNYFVTESRQDVLYARMADVALYAPALIRDNLAIGRKVVMTERAKLTLEAAYGSLFSPMPDRSTFVSGIAPLLDDLPRGTRYVLCVLRPAREFSIEGADLRESLRLLTGGGVTDVGQDDYAVVAGLVGERPAISRSNAAPFRVRVPIGGTKVDIRMESWVAFDTMRRMGFGHVIAARHHALIVERGVSFVAFDADGRTLRTAYAANIFAPQPRFVIESSSIAALVQPHPGDGTTPRQ